MKGGEQPYKQRQKVLRKKGDNPIDRQPNDAKKNPGNLMDSSEMHAKQHAQGLAKDSAITPYPTTR